MFTGNTTDPFTEKKLGKQVTLVGVGDRVELWNTADYHGHLRELMANRHRIQEATKEIFGNVPPQPAPAGAPTPG